MSDKITIEELSKLFPAGIPIVAMKLLFPERSSALTLDELRMLLRLLSADKRNVQ